MRKAYPGDQINKITTYMGLNNLRNKIRQSIDMVAEVETNIASGITSDKYLQTINKIGDDLEQSLTSLNKIIVVPEFIE